MSKSVLVGMSGGVDSSVSAFLLKEQGYNVIGVTMRLCGEYSDNEEPYEEYSSDNAPCIIPDTSSDGDKPTGLDLARAVADKLDIEFMSVDYRNEFQECVVDPFVQAYESGLTPNPCIDCNRCIKFGKLIDDSDEGFEDNMEEAPMLATGHYAIIEKGEDRMKLRKSTNLAKDQSYFLYTLDQETLARTIFPLGQMDKDDVRKIAEEQGFINAKTKDSQDICFIPDGDYAGFIRNYTGKDYRDGYFVDMDGNTLGIHKGIINYTVGQRKGLGLSLQKPMYVYRLNTEKNEVVLADDKDLFSNELTAEEFNWVSIARPDTPFRALARIRYRHKEAPCTVTPCDDDTVKVVFDEAQRAITAGQSVVLYDMESDQYVLGGGKIVG